MSKSLIVYYSLTGNVKYIAEHIQKVLEADVLELKLKEEINSKGFMKFIHGGGQALMKKLPELLPFAINPDHYEMIVIGTPVWAWTFVPAIRTFLEKVQVTNKKIALFCCHGGGKGKVFQKMKAELSGNEFVGEIDFLEPLKQEREEKTQEAIKWADKILSRTKE